MSVQYNVVYECTVIAIRVPGRSRAERNYLENLRLNSS
jgi:hypothetical protein